MTSPTNIPTNIPPVDPGQLNQEPTQENLPEPQNLVPTAEPTQLTLPTAEPTIPPAQVQEQVAVPLISSRGRSSR